jgi:hypothetical protein
VYKDGVVCFISCNKISYINGTFVFNVTGFSSYNLNEASCFDGLQNQNEVGVDCGGSCASCPVYTSSGGGGGGGGASVVAFVSSQNLSAGYTRSMRVGDKLTMNIYGVNHTLYLNKIINNSFVNITIKSDPVNFVLVKNEEKRINLTSSNYNDLYIRLENISSGSASILLRTINESIISSSVLSGNKTDIDDVKNNETVENLIALNLQGNSLYVMVVVCLFILIIIFVVYMIVRFFKYHR